MTQTLRKLGADKGLVLTPSVLDHLGVSDEVEVTLEAGKIIITAPQQDGPAKGKSFEEAVASTFDRYSTTMRDLAKAD